MLSALLLLLSLTIGFLPHLTIEAFRPVYNINIKSRKFRILESSQKNVQQQRSHHQPVLSAFRLPSVFGTVEFRDVLYDDTSSAFDAWEWTSNMGAPAALIAAYVLHVLFYFTSSCLISCVIILYTIPWRYVYFNVKIYVIYFISRFYTFYSSSHKLVSSSSSFIPRCPTLRPLMYISGREFIWNGALLSVDVCVCSVASQ